MGRSAQPGGGNLLYCSQHVEPYIINSYRCRVFGYENELIYKVAARLMHLCSLCFPRTSSCFPGTKNHQHLHFSMKASLPFLSVLMGLSNALIDECPKDEIACHDLLNGSQCIAEVVLQSTQEPTKEALLKCIVHEGTASNLPGEVKVCIPQRQRRKNSHH